MAVKQTKNEEKPGLVFKGSNEEERNMNALIFDRLSNIMERFGKDLTNSEIRTIQYVMVERTVTEKEDQSGV